MSIKSTSEFFSSIFSWRKWSEIVQWSYVSSFAGSVHGRQHSQGNKCNSFCIMSFLHMMN